MGPDKVSINDRLVIKRHCGNILKAEKHPIITICPPYWCQRLAQSVIVELQSLDE